MEQSVLTTTPPVAFPENVMRLATLDCRAHVVRTAIELDVFSALAHGPATEGALRRELGLQGRFSGDFLDVLTALGLLSRSGDEYENTPVTDYFLDRAKPSYLGDFITQMSASHQRAWSQLAEALRTGMVEVQPRGGFLRKSHAEGERAKRFMSVFDDLAAAIGEEIADRVDWGRYETVADLGGARGHLAAVVARRHPHLRAVSYDVPDAAPFFHEHLSAIGLADRVEFVGGDLMHDPIPECDVAVYGQVLHGWDVDGRQRLVRRAYDAVRPGGLLLVYDRMIDDEREDQQRLLYSLYMRLVSPEGSEYRSADCEAWLREAGFSETWSEPLLNTHTLVYGRR
jgi:SAM-dependent methyltransferase